MTGFIPSYRSTKQLSTKSNCTSFTQYKKKSPAKTESKPVVLWNNVSWKLNKYSPSWLGRKSRPSHGSCKFASSCLAGFAQPLACLRTRPPHEASCKQKEQTWGTRREDNRMAMDLTHKVPGGISSRRDLSVCLWLFGPVIFLHLLMI